MQPFLFPRRYRCSILVLLLAGGIVTEAGQPAESTPPAQQNASDDSLEAELSRLLESKQFERAIVVAKQLTAAREGVGSDGRLAEALLRLAEAEAGAGHDAEAVAAYQRGADAAATALGPAHPDVATYLNELGVFQFGRGEYSAAVPVFERALQIREQGLGPAALETAEITCGSDCLSAAGSCP